MHNLAVLTAEGADGKPDYTTAAIWFRKAAEFGIRDSQYNLAILYARGLGVQQDLVQSYMWFSVAAAQGDEDAGKKREDVAAKLDAKSLVQAKAAVDAFHAREPDRAANEVQIPPGGWETAAPAPGQITPKNSIKPKISRL
jgi:localization factor PodJL